MTETLEETIRDMLASQERLRQIEPRKAVDRITGGQLWLEGGGDLGLVVTGPCVETGILGLFDIEGVTRSGAIGLHQSGTC